MYEAIFDQNLMSWIVKNHSSGGIHSSWGSDKLTAIEVASDLNKIDMNGYIMRKRN